MARWKPFPIIGGAYSDDCKPWSAQDTVNYIPVLAEKNGTRSREMLRCLPGYATFCNLGTDAPIRGARNVEGRLFVVSGQTLFSVSPKGVATSLGTIPGVQRCSLSHNQVAGGNQVAISNGQAGYVYDTAKSTLVQITDEGFPGSICFDAVDGYITGIAPNRKRAFTSDLADATSYNTLDQFEAEGSPDLLRGQAITHREWWLMGERTIEPFVNTGDATGTFQRAQGTVIEVGLAATFAVAVMDNSVFWLGNDGIVYRANGYTPTRISTHAIEQAIARCNMGQAFAFTFEDRGHKVFYLTFPDGQTWGFDAATGEWHRRQSYGLNRWRINTLTYWNGYWIAGDFSNGKLYVLDWNIQHEAGEIFERRRITGAFHDSQNNVIVNALELVADTGLSGDAYSPLAPPLKIAGNLPDGPVGEVVSYQYTLSGGVAPRTATVSSGALPAGLSMNTAGLITGTRATTGDFAWVVTATDEEGATAALPDTSSTHRPFAVHFDGTGGNLSAPFVAPIIATGDFTVEGRISVSGDGSYGLISGRNSNIRGWALTVSGNTLGARMSMNVGIIDGGSDISGGAVPVNQLVHVAWTRLGNLFTLWVNGVSTATYTNAGSIDEPAVTHLAIGTSYAETGESPLDGYIDWLAVTVGTCRYTASFTPPGSAADVPGAKVALDFNEPVGSTTFADSGSKHLVWTTTGNAAIAEFPY